MTDKELRHSDFQWFVKNHKPLYEIYGEAYLAIKNKLVIGVYKSFAEGIHETEKREPLGTFIIQYNNGTPSGYTTCIGAAWT